MNDLFTLLRQRGEGCWVQGYFCGIYGYSDDNFLLAPSLTALQSMLATCEEYAISHNLKFSTDPDPAKCKTKCLAFTFKKRELKQLVLCGHPLPWVENCKHLGNYVENKYDGMRQDLKIKQAQFISKNNDLEQEFYFCHPQTKFSVNKIYNSHFTGSPLWNLFSSEAIKLEGTWNRSVKVMYDLPYETHRRLIEPITESLHLRRILIQRFLNFIIQIRKSSKPIINILFNAIKYSVRSTTGHNLRAIMLRTGKENISQLDYITGKDIEYHPLMEDERWKVGIIKECIDVHNGKLGVNGFSIEELDEICSQICIL